MSERTIAVGSWSTWRQVKNILTRQMGGPVVIVLRDASREAALEVQDALGRQGLAGWVLCDGHDCQVEPIHDGALPIRRTFWSWDRSPLPVACVRGDGVEISEVVWCCTATGLVCSLLDGQAVVRGFGRVTVDLTGEPAPARPVFTYAHAAALLDLPDEIFNSIGPLRAVRHGCGAISRDAIVAKLAENLNNPPAA